MRVRAAGVQIALPLDSSGDPPIVPTSQRHGRVGQHGRVAPPAPGAPDESAPTRELSSSPPTGAPIPGGPVLSLARAAILGVSLSPDPDRAAMERRLLLRPCEAADALGISVRAVYYLVASGELPAVRLGRATRFGLDDLRAVVARHRDDRRCHDRSALPWVPLSSARARPGERARAEHPWPGPFEPPARLRGRRQRGPGLSNQAPETGAVSRSSVNSPGHSARPSPRSPRRAGVA